MKFNFNSPSEPENAPIDENGEPVEIRYVTGSTIRLTKDDSLLLFLEIWGPRKSRVECFAFNPRGASLTGDALRDTAWNYVNEEELELDEEG